MKASFFSGNRQKLAAVSDDGVIVVGAYTQTQRSNDAAHAFEQDANFWWLTGIDYPDWWVIIDSTTVMSWLVAPTISDTHQTFDGSLSFDDARKMSGIDTILSHDEASKLLQDMTSTHVVAHAIGEHPHASHFDFAPNPAPKRLWNMIKKQYSDVRDCRLAIAKLRAIKHPDEIAAIKKAIALTVSAFDDIRRTLPDMQYEYEVEAEFSYRFRKSGATGHAYDPIIAGGKNACTLHYNKNSDALVDQTILLMDVGARVDGYAADITRSYSIGVPTDRQRQVHAELLRAHTQIIALIRPGLRTADYHQSVDMIMQTALVNLGLMATMDDVAAYRTYFPHAISHGLGIDVHDSLGQATEFVPGMILTVEPGIYISDESIGIRIEDDILVTDDGAINLSAALPAGL
jgi:Xaa-Pro aminopeptidase